MHLWPCPSPVPRGEPMTPRGRLRKAVKLLDQIDAWNDRTDKLPDYIL